MTERLNVDRIKWSKGHIDAFWDDGFKDLNYITQPITQEEIDTWEKQGYDHVKSFSGQMYDNRNPMPPWVYRLKKIFSLTNQTYTFYRMQTLNIMPAHTDAFTRYMELNGCEYSDVRRILVMLEDWKPGHYFEIDGVGVVNWKAGDWFMWRGEVEHAASNIGIDPRYTLQITGIDRAVPDNWQNLHWFNFTDLPTKKDTERSFRMTSIDKALDNNNGIPYFVYFFNGNIKELETLKHTQEVCDQLNTTGIDIYLYEPLSSYDETQEQFYPPMGNKLSLGFYSEFVYENVSKNYSYLRALELDSIKTYVENNGLRNVRVHTCDYDVGRQYLYYEDHMQLMTDDLFIKMFAYNDFQTMKLDEDVGKFTRKFVCMNWRYTPHRMLIAAYLAANVHHYPMYLTWYFKTAMNNITKEPWYDLKELRETHPDFYAKISKGLNYLNVNAPMSVDLSGIEAHTHIHPYFRELIPGRPIGEYKQTDENQKKDMVKEIYNDIFCDIVTETRFAQPTANVSEKTFRAMYYKKPFILVGPAYCLRYLKELGFKTFDKWFDESYDSTEEYTERLFKILELIDKVGNTPMEELHRMYEEMQEVILHNRNHLDSLVSKNAIIL